MKTDIKTLIAELKEGLRALYGDRLKGLYLFGSYARHEADEESDVDVLVVLDDYESCGEVVDRAGVLGAELSLRYGVSISKVFLREREWRQGDTPFLANVRGEAVAA
ncbi:nucleotidyltransferase domain-containing protein [Candidatus Methylomirabilis sp.]|uniref:nucleotidyltransferase domain-containing protein n=1 Tax=Candidatus Methylomirabilis sp. TaxID=2032687 RepID=UPI003076535D